MREHADRRAGRTGAVVAAALAALVAALAAAVPAAAQPAPQPYGHNDHGGFWDVLPPGTDGTASFPELLNFLTTGAKPQHNADQLNRYGNLIFASPGLERSNLERFFKDSRFGVKGREERRYSPRSDVTIVRDSFGVPHIYGTTRDGAMFGVGYAAAEDRLFLMDALRHVGRAQLSSFAGGAQGNRDFDKQQWSVAPYTEADLQRQVDLFDDLYGEAGRQIQRDVRNYIAGINAYIAEARLDPAKMPGEYTALGRPQGPADWNERDIIATAALVGGIFGKGGGGEIRHLQILEALRKRFGRRRGDRLFRDLRAAEDPEAPTTVHEGVFRYASRPSKPRGRVIPDPGTLRLEPQVAARSGSAARRSSRSRSQERGLLDDLLGKGVLGSTDHLPSKNSNALLVSARESESGHPIAVFGPQTSYYSPQLLMEQDVHAPASEAGPAIDARGAAFAGVNLYVQLGHGRDYAWSATSAGQDIIDSYALDLCEPDGSQPTLDSDHYLYRGQCLKMETLTRTNSWQPTLADSTPAGSETLVRKRTKLGLVAARAMVHGRPMVFTELRSTYFHEVDSALGFMDFNTPERMRNARDFMRAANKILYTFNWFYVDDRDIAYFNSGANPVRAKGVDADFPVLGRKKLEWRNFDPERLTADYTPQREHPHVVNQAFLTSWNNKQARGYRAAAFGDFTSIYRSRPLDDRIRAGIRGKEKMSLVELVDAMADAATVDLRGSHVLPWLLKVIGTPRDAELRDAVEKLRAWARSGAHRIDRDRDGTYEHSDAIRIMDAWWPRLFRAIFEPVLGKEIVDMLGASDGFDDPNRRNHIGSAFQGGWYGMVHKDIRAVLGRRVRGAYSERFCGRGSLARCRNALLSSLREAIAVPASELYGDDLCPRGDQACQDKIAHSATGGITQPLIPWQNRPTYQQVVEITSHRPR